MIDFLCRFLDPSAFWKARARQLPEGGWQVGRTDMRSYVDGRYVHYAYSPCGGTAVPFLGSEVSALRQAVKFAEQQNKNHDQPR